MRIGAKRVCMRGQLTAIRALAGLESSGDFGSPSTACTTENNTNQTIDHGKQTPHSEAAAVALGTCNTRMIYRRASPDAKHNQAPGLGAAYAALGLARALLAACSIIPIVRARAAAVTPPTL